MPATQILPRTLVGFLLLTCLLAFPGRLTAQTEETSFSSELVFPRQPAHNHAPGIAELRNGDLIVSWYRGSGERLADDVAIYGARRKAGSREWSDPFIMADTPGFPDCNTALMTDSRGRLLLFWPVVLANTWESCLTHLMVADHPEQAGPVVWDRTQALLLKPADFSEAATTALDAQIAELPPLPEKTQASIAEARLRLSQKLYQRLGWQPRCKPTVLPSGRILLPLYSDTFSLSLMAISDDGVSWGPVTSDALANPGSGLDGVRLKNGHWVLVCNDTLDGRNRLAVCLSTDEGRTWTATRYLEDRPEGSFHYPCVIQTRAGRIHVVYSSFTSEGKSMQHAEFPEEWITARVD